MQLAIGTVDLAILVTYLLGIVGFGIWVGRGRQDLTDYLVGGRDLPWWAVLVSIVATETSSVTFLSVPGVAFAQDMRFLQLPIGYIVGRYAVAALLLPHYFRGEIFTAYEVLHRRFGGPIKPAASVLFIVTRSLADGLRLYLTAIPLTFITGLDMATSTIVVGIATIVYTFFGGMKAVVWTDFIQFAIYMAGGILAAGLIVGKLPGGFAELLAFADVHSKFRVFDFSLTLEVPYTFWAGLVGGAFVSFGSHGADQLMVQRYFCARGEREARRALTISGWVVLAQFALFLFVGVGLACFYAGQSAASSFKPDQVFASFIVDHLPVGVVGLTTAAVFAAAMSTLSGSLNSSAAATVNDLVMPALGGRVAESRVVILTRILTAVFGVIQIAVALCGQALEKRVIDSVLEIAAFTTGIILGVFLLGIGTKSVGAKAALLAMIGGLATMTCLKLFTRLAWPWYAAFGSIETLLLGILIQRLLFGSEPAAQARAD